MAEQGPRTNEGYYTPALGKRQIREQRQRFGRRQARLGMTKVIPAGWFLCYRGD